MNLIWNAASGAYNLFSGCVRPPEEEPEDVAAEPPPPQPAPVAEEPPAQAADPAPAAPPALEPPPVAAAPVAEPQAAQGEPDDQMGPGWDVQENKRAQPPLNQALPFSPLSISPVRRRRRADGPSPAQPNS